MPSQLPQRYIGDTTVSAIGLGCMNLSIPGPSGPLNEDSVFKVLTEAADLGMTFWDTSSAYGDNEVLIGKWFQKTGRRSEIFLATKFGFRIVDGKIDLCSKPDYVRELCDKSLQRLQTDYIDLFYQHRVDPETPIEYTVETMTQLKSEGKIHNLGLSECSSQTLRRASKVHPIAAAQMEYSPFSLEIESPQTEFLKTARELGVKIVAYAPLGRGLLAGSFKTIEDIDPSRKILPRFSAENFKSNLQLGDAFKMLAKEKNCTTGQLTLAWILAQGPGKWHSPSALAIIDCERLHSNPRY